MCFGVQGSVCCFLTGEPECIDGTMEGKVTLIVYHTLQKWGAKALFTSTTSDLQLSWISLKLRGRLLIGISAATRESNTSGVSQGPSVSAEVRAVSLPGCWVCMPAECRLMSMGPL